MNKLRNHLLFYIIYKMSVASKVFGCKDLRNYIKTFINPYWVNPYFPSIEGALLDGREELLGEYGHEFHTGLQLANFMKYYADNYEKYAEGSSFSAILYYFFTPLDNRYYYRGDDEIEPYIPLKVKEDMSWRSTMDIIHYSKNRLLYKIIYMNDMERLREYFIESIDTIEYILLIDVYRCWKKCYNHIISEDTVSILVRILEMMLDTYYNNYRSEYDYKISYINDDIYTILDDCIEKHSVYTLFILEPLYKLILSTKYKNSNRKFTYVQVGHIDSFVSIGNYSYLENFLDNYEKINKEELHDYHIMIRESQYRYPLFESLYTSRSLLNDMRDKSEYIDNLIIRLSLVIRELH